MRLGSQSVKRQRVWLYGALPNESTFVGVTAKTSPTRPSGSRNVPTVRYLLDIE